MTGTTSSRTEDFSAVLNLPASPDAVSALFASAAGVSRWWGPTEGDGTAGGTLVTSFGDYGVNAMRVLEAGPARVAGSPSRLRGPRPPGTRRSCKARPRTSIYSPPALAPSSA